MAGCVRGASGRVQASVRVSISGLYAQARARRRSTASRRSHRRLGGSAQGQVKRGHALGQLGVVNGVPQIRQKPQGRAPRRVPPFVTRDCRRSEHQHVCRRRSCWASKRRSRRLRPRDRSPIRRDRCDHFEHQRQPSPARGAFGSTKPNSPASSSSTVRMCSLTRSRRRAAALLCPNLGVRWQHWWLESSSLLLCVKRKFWFSSCPIVDAATMTPYFCEIGV